MAHGREEKSQDEVLLVATRERIDRNCGEFNCRWESKFDGIV
jgi:hypothetical protein